MNAKKSRPEAEVEEAPLEEEKEEVVAEIPVAPDAEVAPDAPIKKPLGVKEVIPFKWKLVGASTGMILTLFKAVELEDVEAQLDRLGKEGYYRDLRILDVNEKIEQPKHSGKGKDKGKSAGKPDKNEKGKKAEAETAEAKAARFARSEPVRIGRSPNAPAAKSPGKAAKTKAGKSKDTKSKASVKKPAKKRG